MSKNGGRRHGAGRPVGALTKRTQEIAAEAMKEGLTPLQHMLQVLRDETQEPSRRDAMAVAAAGYLHPKLSSIESKVLIESTEERLRKLRDLLA